MNSSWFAVFWEDEGVEEASPCNYCVEGKGGEWYTRALKMSRSSLVKERSG